MSIRNILAQKGNQVETVQPSSRLNEIVAVFTELNISSVVVVNAEHKPLGIVTDRLIIQALASHGSEAMQLFAADIMQSPAPSCLPDDSVSKAIQLMTNRRVRHLLVEAEDETLGVVSMGDLVQIRMRDCELESRVLRDMAAFNLPAA